MAASNWILYNNARKKILNGTILLKTSVLRCKLYKDGAADISVSANSVLSNITTSAVANISAFTLSTMTIVAVAGSATHKFSGPNLVFSASGGNATTIQYAVVYASGASAGASHVLMWCKLSTAAFDVTENNTLTINTPTNGYFVIY
jgi:hypothetical protein